MNYNNELYHHGILGQKWGRKNGPPYPLDASDHSAAEKKAGWRKSLSVDDSNNAQRRLTEEQKARLKKALKYGAIAAGTGLAVYGAYKLYGAYSGKGYLVDPDTGFRLLKNTEDSAEALSQCNPGRINWTRGKKSLEVISGSSTNCMICTTNYELRRRGFDTSAGFDLGHSGFMPDDFFPKVFSNYSGTTDLDLSNLISTKTSEPKSLFSLSDYLRIINQPAIPDGELSKVYKSLTSKIDSMGDVGSRGNIIVWWKNGGGHSMIWERRADGIHFLDGQTNREYNNFTTEILKNVSADSAIQLLRTDNLTINNQGIKDFIRSETKTKIYIDHGAEVAQNILNTPEVSLGLGSAIAAYSINKQNKQNKQYVEEYRDKHPNSKKTDKEIIKMYRDGDQTHG
jgi:hypothetical protein